MTKVRKLSRVANELHNYIKHRAQREGVGYDLSPEFFDSAIKAGVGMIFGVTFNKTRLLGDEQNLEAFAAWQGTGTLH